MSIKQGDKMLLDRLRQDKQFKELLATVKQKETFFYQVQDKIVDIQKTIDRNKNIIKALDSDSEELQQQINDITMSSDAISSVSEIDKFTDSMVMNEKKQNAFKIANSKLEKTKEHLLLTDYRKADDDLRLAYSKLYEYGREWMAVNIISNEIMEDFNIFFSFFCNPYTPFRFKNSEEMKKGFISKINELLVDRIELAPVIELTGYNKIFKIEASVFKREKKLKELKEVL